VTQGTPDDTRTPSRRTRRLIAIASGTVVLYALAGFLLVPWLIARQVTRQAQSRLHRQATLAKARFNPFTFEARLIGLDLRDRDSTPLVAFDTLVVNLSVGSIVKRALVLDEFRVVRPLVVLRILADGKPAVADLLAKDSTTAPADTAPTQVPRLLIHHLGIDAGTVQVIDQSRSPSLDEQFNDLGLTVDGLSTLPRREGDHRLTVSFSSGAQIVWSGRNEFEPLHLEGAIIVTGARLPRFGEVFGAKLPFRIVRGTGQAEVRYLLDRAPGGGVRLTVPSAGVTLSDLALTPDDLDEEWVRVAKVEVQGAGLAWPARTATVGLIRVSEPWLAAGRGADGAFSWAPYLDRWPRDSTPAPASAAWKARIEAVEVVDGGATLSDRSVTPAFELGVEKVNARIAPVGTDSTQPIGIAATAAVGKGALVSAKGTATRAPLSVALDLAASGFDLRVIGPYLGAAPPAKITAGTASASGKLVYKAGRPAVGFDGRAAIDGFALHDSADATLISWTTMKLEGIHYTGTPDLLRIKSVRLERPFARVAISREREVNLASLQRMLPVRDTTVPPFPYEILEIAIANGSIDFSDQSLILPFRATIDSTRGTLRDIASFGGTAGSVELEGWIAPNGLARIHGTVRGDDPYAATSFRMDVRNILMTELTPYSAQFAGYAITGGRLDMDLNYTIEDRQLHGDHHIVATDLTLGDKIEGGESPGFLVKLAISLLKDKDGKIKLDVPIEGSVDDPTFSYRGIVWSALKSVLGNVASAPFRFLGNLLGIGGDDLELVDFDPGRSDVIPPEREKLDSLTAELVRKPELTLTVEGRYDSIADAAALRETRLQGLITAKRDSLGRKAQADTSTTMMATILEQLYTSRYPAPALDSLKLRFTVADSATPGAKPRVDLTNLYDEMRTQLAAAQELAPGALEALGRDRGLAIQKVMTAGGTLDTTRVVVLDPAPVKRKKQGSSLVPSELGMDAK